MDYIGYQQLLDVHIISGHCSINVYFPAISSVSVH